MTRLRAWWRRLFALDTHAVSLERWQQAQEYEESYWLRIAREGYFHIPKPLFETWHPLVQAWKVWALGHTYDDLQDKILLEVGCGPLGVAAASPVPRTIGLDPLAKQYAKVYPLHKHPCQYLGAAGEAIPLADCSVDLAVCINALDHMQNPLQTLKEIHRVLKPKGRLLLELHLHGETDAGHPTQFELSEVKELLARAGYRILHGTVWGDMMAPERLSLVSLVAERP